MVDADGSIRGDGARRASRSIRLSRRELRASRNAAEASRRRTRRRGRPIARSEREDGAGTPSAASASDATAVSDAAPTVSPALSTAASPAPAPTPAPASMPSTAAASGAVTARAAETARSEGAVSDPATAFRPAGARARRVGASARRPTRPTRAARTARTARTKGGRRARRPPQRRTRGLAGTLGLTFLGAVVPGTGYLFAGRKLVGWVVLAGWAIVAGLVLWYFGRDWHRVIDLALEPRAMQIGALVIGLLLVVWVMVVWTTYRLIRPRERPTWHTVVGNIAVVLVCVIVAAPAVQMARYALATADFVGNIFGDNDTATTPDDVSAAKPFGDRHRVNVLLLGGDGGKGREGVRTDSMILLSIDTRTGKTVTFSLPRNLEKAQFPVGSPLAEHYPSGFTNGDSGSGEYMLNAVYRNVPALHPGVLGKSSNEGADAIKLAVTGTLGLQVDYYVLVNLDGFKQIVDAMGGVTVNINEPVAIGGDTDAGIPPDDYLQPGPSQHLNGFEALWFSRGRWGSNDYERMERQRCMVDAIITEADPANLLLRYLDLIKAGKEIVYTDIPQKLASAFVDLALKVKNTKVKSVVFQRSADFNSADPDFDAIRERVQRAIDPSAKPAPPPPSTEGTEATEDPEDTGDTEASEDAEDAEDACAYRPAGSEDPADAAE